MDLQSSAVAMGFGTRWSSHAGVRAQVRDAPILLMTFMREKRGEGLRAYRCLVLFEAMATENGQALVTLDVASERLRTLSRLDCDPDVREARSRVRDTID